MKRILIIEDDTAILRGLKDNLEFEHYEVLTAAEGEQGYCLVHEKKPDLIILDLMLPRMSGYELCRKIRSEGILIPVLMLTARGEEPDRVRGLDLGADDYMTSLFHCPSCWPGFGLSSAVFSISRPAVCRTNCGSEISWRILKSLRPGKRAKRSTCRERNSECSGFWPPAPARS